MTPYCGSFTLRLRMLVSIRLLVNAGDLAKRTMGPWSAPSLRSSNRRITVNLRVRWANDCQMANSYFQKFTLTCMFSPELVDAECSLR